MKFIWFVTEVSNRNHWGGTFVGYNQGRALQALGHQVVYADPVSDFSYLSTTLKPDWVYLPVEFVKYPFFDNVLYYKEKIGFKLIVNVGIFKDWVKKINCGELYTTQWYGPGIDSFPLDLKYLPHGFSPELHKPITQEIKYPIVFVGRNQPQLRPPDQYLYKLENVKYFGYDWPVPVETVPPEDLLKIYNQARVCPNFHGKSQKGDFRMLNERTYQILASGGFEVCDYIPGMEQFFDKNDLVMARSPREWVGKINYYIAHPEKRQPYITQGLKAVQRYSYTAIMETLLEIIGQY